MSRPLKIVLAVVGGLALLVVTSAVVFFLRFKSYNDELNKEKDVWIAQGADFGKNNKYQDCLDAAIERERRLSGWSFADSVRQEWFLEGCLATSQPSKDFCKNVPGFWSTKDAEWKADQCEKAELGRASLGCHHVFGEIIRFCDKKK